MADLMKEAEKMVKKAKKNLDMKKVKQDASKVGEILKDKKITKEEKKELTDMAKDLLKDIKK